MRPDDRVHARGDTGAPALVYVRTGVNVAGGQSGDGAEGNTGNTVTGVTRVEHDCG